MKADIDATQPLVLLIGTLNSDAILSILKASGRSYKMKRLDSSPENWTSIVSIFDQSIIKCVVVKVTGIIYNHLASVQYQTERDALLERLTKIPHIIFIHETQLIGVSQSLEPDAGLVEEESEYWHHDFYSPNEQTRNYVNELLINKGLNILPYQTNAELNVMATNFITDTEEGLLFRIYVPSGRLWADGTHKFIELFRDYLVRVQKLSVRLDQNHTKHGVVYEIFHTDQTSETPITEESLGLQLKEFSTLLDLSLTNSSQAEEILRSKNIESDEIMPILTRFSKEAKRLNIDMKHEREQKILSIRHRCESELLDALPVNSDLETLASLVDSAIPTLVTVSSALNINQQPLQLSASTGGSITLNFKPQIVKAVNSIVAQEIEGDVHLTDSDKQLIQLIKEFAPNRSTELTSSVHELADSSVPKPNRLLAKQKIKTFLLKAANMGSDLAVKLLQSYIEKQIGL